MTTATTTYYIIHIGATNADLTYIRQPFTREQAIAYADEHQTTDARSGAYRVMQDNGFYMEDRVVYVSGAAQPAPETYTQKQVSSTEKKVTIAIPTNVQLISVIDLRPIDFQSGKRLAIPAEACNICDRCGKLHVKVYEVMADGEIYNVGIGCCKRLFGWEPTRNEVQEKERIAEAKALQEALQKAAQEFVGRVNALVAPRPQFKCMQEVLRGYVAIWHADGVIIASEINHPGIGPEKRAEFAQRWRKAQLEKMLKEYEAEYKANRAEAKRAKQLIQEIKKIA